MYIICKICNPTLQGNGYCAEHSTGGSSYFDNYGKHKIRSEQKVLERKWKVVRCCSAPLRVLGMLVRKLLG